MSAPAITLPAPWGAAVVLGLTEAVTLCAPSQLRGRVTVVQGPGQPGRVADAVRWLLRRGLDLGRRPLPQAVAWARLVARGPQGQAELVNIIPNPRLCGTWLHIFKNPSPSPLSRSGAAAHDTPHVANCGPGPALTLEAA
jgi:hypothetical protein